MKRFVLILYTIFLSMAAIAQTINIDWKVGNNIYSQSTCEYGGDLNVPTAPTKYGYTFQGWASYTPIEYLESTGTQWIDPHITLNFFLKFELDSALDDKDKVKIFGVGGGCTGDASIRANGPGSIFTFYLSYNGQLQPCRTIVDTEKHKIILDIYNGKVQIDNCSLDINSIYPIEDTDRKIYIGAYSRCGSVSLGEGWIGKYYGVKFYRKNILIRDLIPVLDGKGTPCMFDKVESKFYYNQGMGDFIAGPVI